MRTLALLACALVLAACAQASAQGEPAAAADGGTALPEGPPPALTDPLQRFSHQVHAGDNQIGCGVCHPNARHAPVAGLASMATCTGCHKFVAKSKPDVQRLLQAYEEGKPIEWPRINRLPDHTFFTHQRHVAKGVGCAECHGEMKTRQLAALQQTWTMGFCMECHRARGAPTDCLTCHK